MSAPFSISVSDHAYWRAAERFRGFRTETIEEEIITAFREGRVSTKSPPGIASETDKRCLYVWTPDGQRVYVLRPAHETEAFVVLTVMRKRHG